MPYSMRKSFATGTSVFLVCSSLTLAFSGPASGIPRADVRKKLDVIGVYALKDGANNFVVTKNNGTDSVLLFLDVLDIKAALDSVSDPSTKPHALSLSVAYDMLEARNSQNARSAVAFPLVVSRRDYSKAVEILVSQGMTDQAARLGVSVPVFYTNPMISVTGSGRSRDLFFISFDQLEETINSNKQLRSKKPRILVGDLSKVLRLIEETEQDKYAFMPNKLFRQIYDSLKR